MATGNKNELKLKKAGKGGSTRKVSNKKSATQTRNASTGHWIVREAAEGHFQVRKSPSRSITVHTVVQAAPNPSVSKKTAAMAEKAVLEFLNKNLEE